MKINKMYEDEYGILKIVMGDKVVYSNDTVRGIQRKWKEDRDMEVILTDFSTHFFTLEFKGNFIYCRKEYDESDSDWVEV